MPILPLIPGVGMGASPVTVPTQKSGWKAPPGARKGQVRDRPRTRATLGNIPLLASQPITWELREGVAPVIREFPVRSGDSIVFKDPVFGSQRTTLVIEAAGERRQVDNLWVVDVVPGPNPHIDHVRVADRRYWWNYTHIVRRYNMRRKTGVFRPDSPNAELITPILPELAYWKWSLQDGAEPPAGKWTATAILDDILSEVTRAERQLIGQDDPGPPVRNEFEAVADEIPIEDLEIDEAADSALKRVMDFIPGMTCWIDFDGSLVFHNKADGRETDVLVPFEIVDRGHLEFVRKSFVRPASVKSLFSIESEFRCDYIERTAGSDATVVVPNDFTPDQRESSRLLENVAPLPDFSLAITALNPLGVQVEDTIHQGTYVELEDLLGAWGSQAGDNFFPPVGAPAMTLSLMLRGALPFVDLVSGLIPPNTPNADLHMARVNALLENYRRTFRIPERWMNRFLSIRPYRVATIDFATGQRAPATAYCDYAYLRSQPVIIDNIGENNAADAHYGQNFQGYPRTGAIFDNAFQFRAIDTATHAPATVTIADQDQGIIKLDFLTGPLKYYAQAIPGNIKTGQNPRPDIRTNGITADGDPLFFNASPSGGTLPELEGGWKMAVIFTAIPASPNDRRQLFEIEIPANHPKLLELLPPAVRGRAPNVGNAPPGLGQLEAFGPSMDVRIPASRETARVQWKDASADIIMREIFGVDSPAVVDPPPGQRIDDLIVNLRFRGGRAENQTTPPFNELEAIALAEAAQVYTAIADKAEGNAEFAMQDRLKPTGIRGNMESLEVTLHPNGEFTMGVRMPGESPRLSMWSFLDAGTRAQLMRLVQGPAAI